MSRVPADIPPVLRDPDDDSGVPIVVLPWYLGGGVPALNSDVHLTPPPVRRRPMGWAAQTPPSFTRSVYGVRPWEGQSAQTQPPAPTASAPPRSTGSSTLSAIVAGVAAAIAPLVVCAVVLWFWLG